MTLRFQRFVLCITHTVKRLAGNFPRRAQILSVFWSFVADLPILRHGNQSCNISIVPPQMRFFNRMRGICVLKFCRIADFSDIFQGIIRRSGVLSQSNKQSDRLRCTYFMSQEEKRCPGKGKIFFREKTDAGKRAISRDTSFLERSGMGSVTAKPTGRPR